MEGADGREARVVGHRLIGQNGSLSAQFRLYFGDFDRSGASPLRCRYPGGLPGNKRRAHDPNRTSTPALSIGQSPAGKKIGRVHALDRAQWNIAGAFVL